MNLTSFLPLFVEIMLKGIVVLGLAWLADVAWRRGSAASRHLIWLVAFGGLALLPFLASFGGKSSGAGADSEALVVIRVPAESSRVLVSAAGSRAAGAPLERAARLPDWRAGLVAVWLGGAVLIIGRRAWGSVRLQTLRRGSRLILNGRAAELCGEIAGDYGIRRVVEVRVAETCAVAMTWGVWRPVVMLPADALSWGEERLALVLRHELAHVRRADGFVRLCVQVVSACYWMNPLVWVAARRLRLAQEQACDDRVLLGGVTADVYAMELVAVTRGLMRGGGFGAGVPMAEQSSLESRILSIVGEGRDRRGASRRTIVAAVSGAMVALVAGTAIQVIALAAPEEGNAVDNIQVNVPNVRVQARFFEIEGPIPDFIPPLASVDFPRDGAGPKVGLLSAGQASAVMVAMSKLANASRLSAPIVTTRDRTAADITVVTRWRYPTRWETNGEPADWVPMDFKIRNGGIGLWVKPTVGIEGNITLQVRPRITDFEGFVAVPVPDALKGTVGLQVVPKMGADGSLGLEVVPSSGPAKAQETVEGETLDGAPVDSPFQPVFSVRSFEAVISLNSGQTAVLSGLSREVRATTTDASKSSEASVPTKEKTILVFVTATIEPPAVAAGK